MMNRRSHSSGWVAAWFLLCLCCWPVLGAPEPLKVQLNYTEVPFGFQNFTVQMVPRTEVFKREPTISRRGVVRGEFRINEQTGLKVPFLWDEPKRTLYLDLNLNGDLTDDPEGTFKAAEDRSSTYPNVTFSVPVANGVRKLMVDLHCYSYTGSAHIRAELRSFWQGRLELDGKAWHIGAIYDPYSDTNRWTPTELLLRPWADKDLPFETQGGSLATVDYQPKLFWLGRAWELACQPVSGSNGTSLQLTLAEASPVLGRLDLPGKFIDRLVLQGGPYLAVLDAPGSSVQVPVGAYHNASVQLKSGKLTAYRSGSAPDFSQSPRNEVTVTAEKTAILNEGGPLTNTVSFRRTARVLHLNYQVVGLGGREYKLLRQDYLNPPKFTVTKGGRKLLTATFQYG